MTEITDREQEAKFYRDKHVYEQLQKNNAAKGLTNISKATGISPENLKLFKNEEPPKIVLMSKFSPVPYAKSLISEGQFIQDKYHRFWRFDSTAGIWKEDAEEYIRLRLRKELLGEEQQKMNYVQEVVKYILDTTYNPYFEATLAENLIPFNNCLFNIDTEEFIDYSPDYFTTNKLPIDIDPSLHPDCPIIDAFLEDCVTPKYKSILYELCAYCLLRTYPYQKLFFLIGDGSNGKSTFLELLRAFLGNDNVSSVSPHTLCSYDRPFAMGSLWNKYANISSDISYKALEEISKLKGITGEDTVEIERKYKESFSARLYAKLIFSTNQLPIVHDKSFAWYRRLYLIKFPNRFDGSSKDADLKRKLCSPTQLSGLAWQCIKRLKEMKKRQYEFTFDTDTEKVAELYESLSEPLSKFMKENTEEDSEGVIWKFELEERFNLWLKENKLPLWGKTKLGVEMSRLGLQQSKRNYPLSGNPPKQYWAWVGIKWLSHSNYSNYSSTLQTISIYRETVGNSMEYLEYLESKKE